MRVEATKDQKVNFHEELEVCVPWVGQALLGKLGTRSIVPMKVKFFCAHCIIYPISYLVLDKAATAKVLERYAFLQIQK